MISRRRFLLASAAAGILGAAGPRKIRAGCQTNGWKLKEDDFPQFLRTLERIRALGFEGFECNVRYVRAQFGRAAKAREQIGGTGLQFIAAHMNMTQAAQTPGLAEGLTALGAEGLVASGRSVSPGGKLDAAALQAKASALESLATDLGRHGLWLAYHNHQAEFAGGTAEMDGLLAATDTKRVRLLVDASLAYLSRIDVARFFAAHPTRIAGFHMRDYREMNHDLPAALGTGGFDLHPLAAEIRKAQWSGWLITEQGDLQSETVIESDRKYIARIFGV